ncbi:MAG: OmpA family protein [Cyclobacteriaceae bacterium]
MRSCIFILLFYPAVLFGQDIFRNVNSSYDEQLPVLSPDHKTLYFTRANHPDNVGGRLDPGDIWYSELMEDGTWSQPVNARDLNNRGYNGVVGFTVDSRTIYLLNHYNKDESRAATQGVSRAVRRGNGWSRPENMEIPYFLNRSENHGGFISQDGQVLVFSIEGYKTTGGEDIYVSFNEGNGRWSEPTNLGRTINTSAQEFTPFLSGDKSMLYFSSNGHGGAGSSDVFVSRRLDDTWQNWSEPMAVENINSQGRELAYRPYEGFALYTSTVNSDGFSDIRIYTDNPDQPIEPQVVNVPDSLVEDVQQTVTIDEEVIYGSIKSSDQRTPVPDVKLRLSIDGNEQNIQVDPVTGTFNVPINQEGTYVFYLDAPGYISSSETLLIEGDRSSAAVERQFLLQPIEVGTTVKLPNVLFKQSSPDILPESYPELDRVVDFMRTNPNVKIRLEGHTDSRGVPKHNMRLSKARVESVEEYLVSKGINHRRISGKGYGGTQPIADNADEETRRLNRRVEFTIVKD